MSDIGETKLATDTEQQPGDTVPQPGDIVKRHRLSTRVWHWTNALTLLVMLMSGLGVA